MWWYEYTANMYVLFWFIIGVTEQLAVYPSLYDQGIKNNRSLFPVNSLLF